MWSRLITLDQSNVQDKCLTIVTVLLMLETFLKNSNSSIVLQINNDVHHKQIINHVLEILFLEIKQKYLTAP